MLIFRKAWAYLNHCNLKIAIDFNPFVWSFRWIFEGPTALDPALRILYIRFLPVSIIVVIDDGTYHMPPPEIEASEEGHEDHIDVHAPGYHPTPN